MSEFDKWINKNYSGSFDMPHQRDCFEAGQQSQQDEIDSLNLKIAEMKSRLNDNYTAGQTSMYLTKQPKIDELQAKVDKLESFVKSVSNWNAHPEELELNKGSWGVRDFYRNYADKILKENKDEN